MRQGVRIAAALLISLIPVQMILAASGTLFLTPEYGAYSIGERFDVGIYADTGGTSVGAAEADLAFDPTALSVVGISTANSILGSWSTEPAFSNADGTVSFSGWASSDYAGNDGLLATVTFEAVRNVTTSVRFTSGALLAAQGGSDIVASLQSAAFSIRPQTTTPSLSSTTAPVESNPLLPPPPRAPALSSDSQTIAAGSSLIIKGTAAPDEQVEVWTQFNGGAPSSALVESGPDGSFAFVSDQPARQGTYVLWAQTQDAYGQQSDLSQKVTITAAPGSLTAAAAAAFGPGAAAELVPFAFVLLAASFAAGYLFHSIRTRRRS